MEHFRDLATVSVGLPMETVDVFFREPEINRSDRGRAEMAAQTNSKAD